MKRIELILIGLALLGFVMLFFHLAGTALVLLVSLGALSMYYYFAGVPIAHELSFTEAYRSATMKRIGFTGVVASFSLSGKKIQKSGDLSERIFLKGVTAILRAAIRPEFTPTRKYS